MLKKSIINHGNFLTELEYWFKIWKGDDTYIGKGRETEDVMFVDPNK